MRLDDLIMEAIEEKKIFIGYFMLCRFLNGKGYIRYGCNAGYEKGKTNGKDRLEPCKILCKDSKIYRTKVRYWVRKLERKKKLHLEKKLFKDSQNPFSKTKAHKLDCFVIIREAER